jgi:hypothetical protein
MVKGVRRQWIESMKVVPWREACQTLGVIPAKAGTQ